MIDLYYNLTQMVVEAGGFEKLAERLEYEWSDDFIIKPIKHPVLEKTHRTSRTYYQFSPVETKYILENYHNMPLSEMSRNLKITYRRLYHKIQTLKKRGKLNGFYNNS